jgi:predicted esterase
MPARSGGAALRRALVALVRPFTLLVGVAAAITMSLAALSLGVPPSAVAALLGFRAARADAAPLPPIVAEPPRPAPPAPPPAPTGPLHFEADGRPVVALPGEGGPSAPVTVVLHGMCTDVEALCALVAAADPGASHLVCPRGNASCQGGAPDWTGPPAARALVVDAALAAFEREVPASRAGRPVVLAGYSRGAFTARDLAYLRPGRFGALVLLSAAVAPDPARLAASGVKRVVLASGDFDGSRATMERSARALTAAGIPARFVSLGKIGHWLPPDLEACIGEHVRWASEPLAE